MKTMNETDVHSFLETNKDSEYYALWYTYLYTALRRSELLALQWSNVDLLLCQFSVTRSMEYNYQALPSERVKFKEPKTAKSRRLIALVPSNALVLREHREKQEQIRQSLGLPPLSDNDLVFSKFDGKPYPPDGISHAWMKAIRRFGMNGIRLHDTRHTHASIMLKQGVHPKIVQERLGHASISTTLDLYSHVAPGLQAAAAAKFDDIMSPKESAKEKVLVSVM
jgi:integrase